ncbi:N,N-dimethylformamidase beta subunit family domain-containing protein [Pseudogemmobacter sonorensis]|uniref:N,N-dimethylformamidase beta subunit family domain-containing protein n=1 Tax=Pseudogemmobacter sonorensis TaxID=2989681 RepID=UPI0036ACD092
MRRAVDHGAMRAAGYVAPWSLRAGESAALHLSAVADARCLGVERLDLPEPARMGWVVATLQPPAAQAFLHGSFLHINLADRGALRRVAVEFQPRRNPGRRPVLALAGFGLWLDDGCLVAAVEGREDLPILTPDAGAWHDITLEFEAAEVTVTLRGHDPLRPAGARVRLAARPDGAAGLTIGAQSGGNADGATLNARIGRIAVSVGDQDHLWRFPTILPEGPMLSDHADPLPLNWVNLPTFCLPSPRWDGSTFDPRLAPDQYDALHLHDDDMGPLDWPATFRVDVPPEAPPGIYAFVIRSGEAEERIPFFLRGRERRAPLLFLVPTATYLAYADEALPPHLFPWLCEDRGQRFAERNGLRSLYDYHNDTSGVSICSWRKPKATLRPDYRYPLCGDPHNLPVDLHFLRFARANGIEIDLVTDHDLDREGAAALEGYAAVVTGSHPEYMSVGMEAALRGFAVRGGSIAYLGGNGFAATVAFRDDLMELRRSPLEAGRTWDAPVSELHLALTNEPGGYLRGRGKGEYSLVGVAISLMGFGTAQPYTRSEESRDPRFAWLFEGVPGDSFGHEGIVLGGAAGYEVDATDPHLGTPPDTVVLARAHGFDDSFYHDPARWYEGGADEARLRACAEMTIRPLPGGNLIFSASSVAWCGALPFPGKSNDVGRITLNLLRRLATFPPVRKDHPQQET